MQSESDNLRRRKGQGAKITADLLAALVILERHLPFLEQEGCIGDGDRLAIAAAIAAARSEVTP